MIRSPFLSRVLALAILGALMLMAWLGVVQPVREHLASLQEEIAFKKGLIQRLEANMAGRSDQRSELVGLIGMIADSPIYIRGETRALAAAALQEELEDVLDSAGVELRSVQNLLPGEGSRRIGLRVSLSGDYEAVIDALDTLERGEPLLFIDMLHLKRSGATVGGARQRELAISAALDIYGYLPPDPAS